MITTVVGIRVEFEKLDDWVIQMKVSTKNGKAIVKVVLTIDQLKQEIALLEQ